MAGRVVLVILGSLALAPCRTGAAAEQQAAAVKLTLPAKPKSVRFLAIGDNGTGGRGQYEVARQMEKLHDIYPFEFVIMLGDNIYGGHKASDFKRKFEEPYKPLLDAGVKFYASLGNHDDPNERFYKPFNMGGKRYYSFKKGNAEFFALDSNYMDPQQVNWLDEQLRNSGTDWKICFFHHPLYSDGRFHGADTDLRALIAPLFEKDGVNVVFSGHEHIYERIKPQNGIYYFVCGDSGELRPRNLRPSANMAKGFDTGYAFMAIEIDGDKLYFQVISGTGDTVDSGVLERPRKPAPSVAGQATAPAAAF